MHRLRNRLIATFLAATLVPLAATVWITTSLIEQSLDYAPTEELDRLSRSLEGTVREFYRRERDALREAVAREDLEPIRYDAPGRDPPVREFWESGEAERFQLSGEGGNRLELLMRTENGVEVYTRGLGNIHMEAVAADLGRARSMVESFRSRDLRRGFTLTLVLLVAAVWLVSLGSLVLVTLRITRPIQRLTAGLTALAAGDGERHVAKERDDEIGRAVDAFNAMAGQLDEGRKRLVYLTQIASWQSLARKTAHELKNSLTPIRLTVEEMLARQKPDDRQFMEQAAEIVVHEIETLERRVRSFSEFSSEPRIEPREVDINNTITERVSLLQTGHPSTLYETELDPSSPIAWADPDLVKGILTNLFENAADAAGNGGRVLAITRADEDTTVVEVHDSGPGLAENVQEALFEPTITFKKHGMGLGLSIARKNALISGGDIVAIAGRLGGAAFRVVLPRTGRPPGTEAS